MISKIIKLFILSVLLAPSAFALKIVDRLSPFYKTRPYLSDLQYIILHTTEGEATGSLNKLRSLGQTNFMVDRHGNTFRVIPEGRLAGHAGLSMWNGRTSLDLYSIGIEIVGYHDEKITAAQEKSLAVLLQGLKKKYNIADQRILTHSMVAYGYPNRYVDSPHRGRKRCGMNLADPQLRARLGIGAGPAFDPDVRAGRLTSPDHYLAKVLYDHPKVKVQVAKLIVEAPGIPKRKPGGRLSEADSEDADALEDIKVLGQDGNTPYEIAGSAYAAKTTLYVLPNGTAHTGADLLASPQNLLLRLPLGTQVLVGYEVKGTVSSSRTALSIVGRDWEDLSILYYLPSRQMLSGDIMDPEDVPRGTVVLIKK